MAAAYICVTSVLINRRCEFAIKNCFFLISILIEHEKKKDFIDDIVQYGPLLFTELFHKIF